MLTLDGSRNKGKKNDVKQKSTTVVGGAANNLCRVLEWEWEWEWEWEMVCDDPRNWVQVFLL